VKYLALAILIFGTGCAVRQPAPLTYRLVPGSGTDSVLVPPGVRGADVEESRFVANVAIRKCAASIAGPVILEFHGKRSRVTVRREDLVKKPGDWLSQWGAELETRGCVARGDGRKLAAQVAESVPMDSRVAFRLLYGEAVDIGPPVRIQVDSPILRDDAGPILGPVDVAGAGGSLEVTVRASSNLLGYERAWYAAKAKAGGDGASIVALSADRHVDGATEQRPQPAKNYLMFPSEAGYYRLIYKQEQTDFTALVVAGRTRAELDEHAGKLSSGGANCAVLEEGYCLPVPKGVAANLFLPVTVNGKEELIHWGGTVGDAVGRPRERPATLMQTLEISKLHNGKPAAVEFDRSKTTVLGLRLVGGETITWKASN
jgi:hypothetical protein